jgi:hypothetical protein
MSFPPLTFPPLLMLSALIRIKKTSKIWYPLVKTEGTREYLPYLDKDSALSHAKLQVQGIIREFLENYLWKMYPKLLNYTVGALRSKGTYSQLEKHDGNYHTDFLKSVIERTPEERPHSIIVALDPFQLNYKQHTSNGKFKEQEVIVRSDRPQYF